MFVLFTQTFSEKVGVFKSNTALNEKDTAYLTVPTGVVGLSGDIPISADSIIKNISTDEPASLFFIIDHSISMFQKGIDKEGNRFKIVNSILDTLISNPDKYRNIECGVAVFANSLYFQESSSPVLKTLKSDNTKGAYLPLLGLTKSYPEDGNKTGKEIIKELLKTYTSNDTAFLTAEQHPVCDMGITNIDPAFTAAIEAMSETSTAKKNQYIIFVSDGDDLGYYKDENGKIVMSIKDFEDGKIGSNPIPTTFTIFFTKDGTAPASLKTMTKNIKSNGYSSSNTEHSSITPYENTTLEALEDYIITNIASVLESSKISKPDLIEIGGESSSKWDATGNFFTFPHPLALTGKITEFKMNLSVSIAKDSMAADSSLISTVIDSVINLVTKTTILQSLTEADANGEITWWDRNLNIYSGNTSIDEFSEIDRNLTVKFDYDPLQSNYSYKNADISVRCVNSNDSVQLSCSYSGNNSFDADLLVDHIGSVSFTDNKITPDSLDEIIVTFRNSEAYPFPLDTIEKRIFYERSTDFKVEKGIIYDENSDGYCDKIEIQISGDTSVLSAGKDEIVSHLVLPISRSLTIERTTVTGNVLTLYVSTGESINTGKNSDDYVTVSSDVVISTGGILRASSTELIDAMAPVCTSAILIKNASDTDDSLTVTFSETIESNTSIQPFVIISQKGYSFEPELNGNEIESNINSYIISKDASDSIAENDSLYISIVADVDDTLGNIQTNPLNKRVPIFITTNSTDLSITSITFYDPDGKGFPSLSKMEFSNPIDDEVKEILTATLQSYFENIASRDLSIERIEWQNSTANIYLNESGDNYVTEILADDKFEITSPIVLSNLYYLSVTEMVPVDSMAPVCTKALLKKNASNTDDSLFVTFSEKIESIAAVQPFVVISQKGYTFEPELSNNNDVSKSYAFTLSKDASDSIVDNDSLYISTTAGIDDKPGNTQVSELNKRVPIIIEYTATGILISDIVFIDTKGGGHPTQSNITFSLEVVDEIKSKLETILITYFENLSYRELSINSIEWDNNIAKVMLTENGDNVVTTVLESDVFKNNAIVELSEMYEFATFEIMPRDSMAPVCMKATLYDHPFHADDSLVVHFSEALDIFESDTPFVFYRNENESYALELKQIGKKGQSYTFLISDNQDSHIREGDSLNISTISGIADSHSNQQLVTGNKKVEIEIVKSNLYMNVDKISFHDPQGKGFPAVIKVTAQYELPDTLKPPFQELFIEYVEALNPLVLEVDSVYWKSKTLVLENRRKDESYIKTVVSSDDLFSISDAAGLSENIWISVTSIEPEDSMAPVLIQAVCVDSIATDSISHLKMVFSEDIQNIASFSSEAPYLFLQNTNLFPVDLEYLSHSDKVLITVPTSELHTDMWEKIDSVRINPEFGITDGETVQTAPENRMVELEFEYIAPPLELELKASMITSDVSESHIIVSPIDTLSLYNGVEITGDIVILDKVGNVVSSGIKLLFDEDVKNASCIWDGTNALGRVVGSGIYPVFANILPIRLSGDNRYDNGIVLMGYIAVKRDPLE